MNTNGKMMKPLKKTKSTMAKFTDLISSFLGSWWAVVIHTLWFSVWLVFNFDMNVLTFSVSLEAIFIGIFLLMASNRAEEARDKKEARLRKNDRARLETDIKLDERADRQLMEIKRIQRDMNEQMGALMKEVKSLKK
ncbi:DUF1003 domain-containing protein [Patescibacteria group bacterium]|nr:DUF1003 domain-containing protein [Patescibacteria group bacterium]